VQPIGERRIVWQLVEAGDFVKECPSLVDEAVVVPEADPVASIANPAAT